MCLMTFSFTPGAKEWPAPHLGAIVNLKIYKFTYTFILSLQIICDHVLMFNAEQYQNHSSVGSTYTPVTLYSKSKIRELPVPAFRFNLTKCSTN